MRFPMHESLKVVIESVDPAMRKAIYAIYSTVFENAATPTSTDAVEHLKATVGVNPNEVKDGTKIVGLASKVGMDGETSLAKDEDEILNQVSNDMADIHPIDVQLPEEQQFDNLPTGGGPVEEPAPVAAPNDSDDADMTWDDIQNEPAAIPDDTSDETLDSLLNG